jgi:hypothetical protein
MAVKLGDQKAVFITSDRKRLGEFPRFLGRDQKVLEIRQVLTAENRPSSLDTKGTLSKWLKWLEAWCLGGFGVFFLLSVG